MTFRPAAAVLVLFCVTPAVLQADDWPQWRGPTRDGIWRESGLIAAFAGAELAHEWRAPVGGGYSGPTVAAGRVYLTDRVTQPAQAERVLCFDAASGSPVWSHTYPCEYTISYPDGPRAAVTVDKGRAYALGAMGNLVCCDAATGAVLWQRDLKSDYRIRVPMWGIAAAPLVERELLIVQVGGQPEACLVAFDAATGAERWHALADQASYSAPIMVEHAGKRVLVCWTGERVVGLEPGTGAVVWAFPFPAVRAIINIATPVADGDLLFVSDFWGGALMLRLTAAAPGVEAAWQRKGESEQKTEALHALMCTPLILGDHIYGIDSYGELRCLDKHSGDRVWESVAATPKARWSNAHLVRNGDRCWLFNERGELVIARLSPQGYEEISRARLIRPTTGQLDRGGGIGVCWTHPAFANRRVFVRNDEELVCANLAAAAPAPGAK